MYTTAAGCLSRVEKYTHRKDFGLIPTQVLLSLDIKTIFNFVSRQKPKTHSGYQFSIRSFLRRHDVRLQRQDDEKT